MGDRGPDARRDRGGILRPPEIRQPWEGGSNARLARGSGPPGSGGGGGEGGARGLGIRAGLSRAERAATDAAEAAPAAHGRAAPCMEGPRRSLPPPPSGLLDWAWGNGNRGPTVTAATLEALGLLRGRAEKRSAGGLSLAGASACKGCGRGVGGGSRPSAAHRQAWGADAGRGSERYVCGGCVGLHARGAGAGGASHSRWLLPFFFLRRPLSLQVTHFPGKSAGLLCSDSANCASIRSVSLEVRLL